jgi:hypothetical protein
MLDVRDYYLGLYSHIHFEGQAEWTLAEPMTVHYRTVLPEHNSVAWSIWHIARGEDWAIQTILQGQEQLLTRDGWGEGMRVTYPGFGGGMTREEMLALSAQIDLDALRGYYTAVAEATQAYMRTFDFDTLNTPFDVESRLALVPEAQGPSPFHRQAFPRWTAARTWVNVFTVVDVAFHFNDADHVLGLLVPDRETD